MPDAAAGGRPAGRPAPTAGAARPAPSGGGLPALARPDPAGGLAGPARAHWLMAAAVAGGAALRAVVMLGYPPAMWFNDSYLYVSGAVSHATALARPSGYSAFLLLLLPLHKFALVAAVQHLMGLAIGVLVYAAARRRGTPGWLAVLAAVPVLYGAYQVQLEQQVMSDTLFMLLVTAAVAALCWRERAGVRAATAAGVLLGGAMLVRPAGLLLPAVAAGCLLLWRAGWRPAVALLAAGATPVAGYVMIFHLQHGPYAMTEPGGTFLYGRVMTFAQCRVIRPPPSLARLCDPRPPGRRGIAAEYIWHRHDPLWKLGRGLFTPQVSTLAQRFALRAITAQPLAYLRAVASDTWRAFGWSRELGYDRRTQVLYLFSTPPPRIPGWADWHALRAYQPGLGQPRAVAPFAGFLAAYQRVVYLRGTLLGLILAGGLAGLARRWRDRGGPGLLPWTAAVALLVLPVAVSGFSYRYLLPVVPPACLAAALAFARPGLVRHART
jgi:uncharacterized membrane protein YhaH (DUF805 family)